MNVRHPQTARKASQINRTNTSQSPKRFSNPGRRLLLRNEGEKAPFSPPEDWYEPTGEADGYRIVVQSPGPGYSHVLSPEEVRARLAELPAHFLDGLEVVQLSRMTRKKMTFPCYGMQWGATLYLYPLEESREEMFYAPPRPQVVNESRMYGGKWDNPEPTVWRLTWSESAIRDFYLNNILIHELGHLLDDRNTSYQDRERYAEWFAIEYGYLPTGGRQARRTHVRRRHHSC